MILFSFNYFDMSIIIRTDVTAVKLFEHLVFSGIGSYLHVNVKETGKPLHKIHLLSGQKIYGIVPNKIDNQIIVYGGKQFRVISLETKTFVSIRLTDLVICDDWIHDATWIHDYEIALLTAHNTVQIWDIKKRSILKSYSNVNNSILYSGRLVTLKNDVLVLAGTVFSQIILHRCKIAKPLHILEGHRGVIFSVTYDLLRNIIITTSDDRSVRIWHINYNGNSTFYDEEYWDNCQIICKQEVYGHTARVLRSTITSNCIVSAGEDSLICFWDFEGNLLKKKYVHHSGAIWSIDSDTTHLVTGGGDSAVILHSLKLNSVEKHTIVAELGIPKRIVFTARGNIVILNDSHELIYYDQDKDIKLIHKLKHESSRKFLSISSCKQIVSVVDMNGNLDVFIETCKSNILQNIGYTKLICKVLSMQWAGNRHLILCCDKGEIVVLAANGFNIDKHAIFELPPCRERWLTAADFDYNSKIFALGDRCGNVHIYNKEKKEPLKTRKVHGRYGPTSIKFKNNDLITTGRDGTIKYFTKDLKLIHEIQLSFDWVEKFLDRDENLISGFHEKKFIVYDIKNSDNLIDIKCGGGHRSWDSIRYFDKNNDETIRLVYLKQSIVNLLSFKLNETKSKFIIKGSNPREINCLAVCNINYINYFIHAGEDTTVRISLYDPEDIQDKAFFKHISSVRTLKVINVEKNKLILFTGGGRAQICINKISFIKENDVKIRIENIVNYLIKDIDKDRKNNNFDPETRIMSMDVIKINNDFLIPVGCSDSLIRIFKLTENNDFLLIREINFHKTCVLKVRVLKILGHCILITTSTIGEVVFYNITEIDTDVPIFVTNTNKSGINSFAVKFVSENEIFISTGGDDNEIHIVLLKISLINDSLSFSIISNWNTNRFHCAQITGMCFVGDNYLLSASIDQRVTLSRLSLSDCCIACEFVSQVYSDVSDIQGMDIIKTASDAVTICVFGKGLEVINIDLPR